MKYRRTVSMYLVSNDNKVLLIFHPKFNVWLPPGGHVEDGESSWNALRREMLEEVGYNIGDGIVHKVDSRATQIQSPFFVQLEDHGNGKHVESQLFYEVLRNTPKLSSPENLEMRWWSIGDILDSKEVFDNTKCHIKACRWR